MQLSAIKLREDFYDLNMNGIIAFISGNMEPNPQHWVVFFDTVISEVLST